MFLHPWKTKCMVIRSKQKLENTGQLKLKVQHKTILENVIVQILFVVAKKN
jgi:hypothetical protein